MKRNSCKLLLPMILLLCLPMHLVCCATEKSNKGKPYVYVNHDWKFRWTLPSKYNWYESQGSEKHTVFRAESEDEILVFVNVNADNELPREVEAIWDYYDQMKQFFLYVTQMEEQQTGIKSSDIEISKVRFAGGQAIKQTRHLARHDDVVDFEGESVSYSFVKRGAVWSVTLKCSPEMFKRLGESGIKEIFAGFSLTAS